jgi:glutamate-1-semialdehyde aminotransferase
MLDEGIRLLHDGHWCTSTAHTNADIDFTLSAAARVLA